MELRSAWPDLDEKARKFKASMHRNLKDLSVLDDILNLIRSKLDGKKRVEIIRKHLEEKKNVKEQCIAEKTSFNEKLESRRCNVAIIDKEIQILKSQESEALKEKEAKEENVKSIWKAQRLSMHFYKERLGCHIQFQDEVIHFRFTTISEDEKKRYLLKLSIQDGKLKCLDMIPRLKTKEMLIDMLNETNDIQGFLACIRKKFKKIAKSN